MLRSGSVQSWWLRTLGRGSALLLPLLALGCGERGEDLSAASLNAAQNAYEIYGVYEVYDHDGPGPGPGADAEGDTYTPPDDPIEIAESAAPRASRYVAEPSEDSRPVVPPPPPLMEDEFIDPFSTVEEAAEAEVGGEEQAAVESDDADAGDSEAADAEEEPAADPNANLLTPAKVNLLVDGIAYDEAVALLGVGSEVISTSGDNDEIVMYRFADERGANFMARFEDGRLSRKTNLHVPASETEEDAEEEAEAAADAEDGEQPQVGARQRPRPAPRPTRDPEPEEQEEGDAAATEDAAETSEEGAPVQEDGDADANQDAEQEFGEQEWEAQQQQQQQQEEFVEEEYYEEPYYEEDYVEPQPQARAQLPDYRRSLRRGIHSLRLSNPTDSAVEVGVRSGTQGQDVRLSPGGSQTIRLDSGAYQVYYIFNALPHQLFGGGSVSLESYGMPDAEVILLEGGFNVQGFDPMRR